MSCLYFLSLCNFASVKKQDTAAGSVPQEELVRIGKLIEENRAEEAIAELDRLLTLYPDNGKLLYLRGNAWRKTGSWGDAINDFLAAAEADPQGPGAEAASILSEILEFRNKDLYNQ